ncbi:hypothetical protein [Bacillus sp. YC2]|uniref:hypothetical protein n=1 Tax=Bacillus sp. YC2 TaxID=2861287 RepID=UPI00223A760F|nr:hypothetical protein [Bacillus sp. YC2]
MSALSRKEPIRIVYADYYPNGEIIERVARLFQLAGADVSIRRISHFNDYYHLDKKEFDIELHLFLPSYMHYLSQYFIRDIPDQKMKKTIINFIRDKKRRNFLVYSRIQLIITQFVLGKVCICKIHV